MEITEILEELEEHGFPYYKDVPKTNWRTNLYATGIGPDFEDSIHQKSLHYKKWMHEDLQGQIFYNVTDIRPSDITTNSK